MQCRNHELQRVAPPTARRPQHLCPAPNSPCQCRYYHRPPPENGNEKKSLAPLCSSVYDPLDSSRTESPLTHSQAHAESPFDNPVRIIPTIVLPRAYFPLQWLSGVPARLYHCSNHIPALSEPGKIAVVKMEGERQLSAVESLEKDAYVLYKLSTQVRLKDVRKLYAQLSRLRMDGEPTERVEYKDAWWEDIGSMTYPFTEHPLMPRQLESITERATPLNPVDQNM